MALLLIVIPIFFSGVAILVPGNRLRPLLLPLLGLVHAALTVLVLLKPEMKVINDWLVLDPVGAVFLIAVSALYLPASFYAAGYLRLRLERQNRIFTACFSAFLGLITLVVFSYHLGLMWVAIEGLTLVTAPLIYFNKTGRSIEATWKYLLVGSVGIAVALLGIFFLSYSAVAGGHEASMEFPLLARIAPFLSKTWLRAGFVLLLVGFGTKMGLSPMHTWKPDAYGEAPGVVGAVLAGGVTSGAFLALLRINHIMKLAGDSAFSSNLFIFMGLLSMLTAGVFMLNQRDFKRSLAYSSVEHMGILSLGTGLGGMALWGALLHVMANAVTKGMLFLSAGNIHRAYKNKSTEVVYGAYRYMPVSAAFFIGGFFAITGAPPFGPFVSEFSIVSAAFSGAHYLEGVLFLVFLLLVFIGMGITILRVVQGEAPSDMPVLRYKEPLLTTLPLVLYAVFALVLGLFLPQWLKALLYDAVRFLETAL